MILSVDLGKIEVAKSRKGCVQLVDTTFLHPR